MKKLIIFLAALVLTGCANKSQDENISLSDRDKIVATSVATVEILDKLNLDLEGVPTTTRELPERYKNVTEVGPPMNPDLEVIKVLNPTDVIGPSTLESTHKQNYENMNIPYTFINLKNLYKMHEDIKMLGDKYNRQEEAKVLIDNFEQFNVQLSNLKNNNIQPKVLVLMGFPGAYVVATKNSYVGHLVELAGGLNVFDSDTEDFLNINPEEMLQKDPDIILRASHALPEKVVEMFSEEFETNSIWKHFSAVKNNRVYDLDYNNFGMSATLNYPEALEFLKELFY